MILMNAYSIRLYILASGESPDNKCTSIVTFHGHMSIILHKLLVGEMTPKLEYFVLEKELLN